MEVRRCFEIAADFSFVDFVLFDDFVLFLDSASTPVGSAAAAAAGPSAAALVLTASSVGPSVALDLSATAD